MKAPEALITLRELAADGDAAAGIVRNKLSQANYAIHYGSLYPERGQLARVMALVYSISPASAYRRIEQSRRIIANRK